MGEYIQSRLPKELVEMVARNLELKEMVREFGNNLSLFKDVKDVNLGLRLAVLYRKKALAKFFIDKGANDLLKPLEIASRNGYLHVVKDLLEWGAHDFINYGMMAAAEGNHKDIIDYLITQGAYHWNMGMYGAARKCHKKLIEFFFNRGANDFNKALDEAALCGNLDIFKMFEKKVVLEYQKRINYVRYLQIAARNNNKNIINYILKHHPSKPKSELMNIAKGAAQGHQIELLRDTLQKLGNVDNWDFILAGAAEGGHIDIVNQIIEKMEDVDVDTWNSIMDDAVKGNHKELALYAVSKGANDFEGGLERACSVHNLDLIQFFIDKGANDWYSALLNSAYHGFLDLVKRFMDENYLNAAMMSAIHGGFNDIVYYLISIGADDFEGGLRVAAIYNNLTLVKYFVSKGLSKDVIERASRRTTLLSIQQYLRSQL